jgi:hypothetical protein
MTSALPGTPPAEIAEFAYREVKCRQCKAKPGRGCARQRPGYVHAPRYKDAAFLLSRRPAPDGPAPDADQAEMLRAMAEGRFGK